MHAYPDSVEHGIVHGIMSFQLILFTIGKDNEKSQKTCKYNA